MAHGSVGDDAEGEKKCSQSEEDAESEERLGGADDETHWLVARAVGQCPAIVMQRHDVARSEKDGQDQLGEDHGGGSAEALLFHCCNAGKEGERKEQTEDGEADRRQHGSAVY